MIRPDRRFPNEMAFIGAGSIGPDLAYHLISALPEKKMYPVDIAEEASRNTKAHQSVIEDSECLSCHHPDRDPVGPRTTHPNFVGCFKCHNDEVCMQPAIPTFEKRKMVHPSIFQHKVLGMLLREEKITEEVGKLIGPWRDSGFHHFNLIQDCGCALMMSTLLLRLFYFHRCHDLSSAPSKLASLTAPTY